MFSYSESFKSLYFFLWVAGTVARNTVDAYEYNETCMYTNNSSCFGLRVQSDEVVEENTTGGGGADPAITADSLTSQTVTFTDNAKGEEYNAPRVSPGVAMVDGTQDLQLGSFISRPTLIHTYAWTTATTGVTLATFKPWQLLLSSTAIKKKLDNFAFLRGTLHLKTVVNGTPFQYGSIRLCYSPLEGIVPEKLRTNGTTDIPYLIPYSQQPGYFLTPSANAGGEMACPFVLHKNWLDITDNTEVGNMGTCRLVLYYPLALAVSGGTSTVTLQTYAWIENLELMASTAKLLLQGDEYVEGPISGPATAVAKVAAQLSTVPVIGKFARATQIGAGALANVAHLFGYTNAPVIEDVKMMVPSNGPQLASAQIGTPVQKLALDPKQELSIDPAPHGCGDEDQLSLAYIKKKESYFGIGIWQTSDAVGTQLFNARINPAMLDTIDIVNGSSALVAYRAYHTPLSYYGHLFRQWRGGLKFRMRLICTKFHKGRLIVQYDPRNDITASQPAENTVYTHIVDIGENDNIEFEIPYHQDTPWLDTDHTLAENWSLGNSKPPRLGIDNGVLTVRVLTALTAPASGSIALQMFISGADDFEYANPVDRICAKPYLVNTEPSFFNVQGQDKVEISTTSVCFGNPSTASPDRYGMNYGESVTSLRNLLHRYSTLDTTSCGDMVASSVNVYTKHINIMPHTPGFDSNGASTANKIVGSGTAPYSFVMMHQIPYISNCFLGYRGGVNVVFTPDSQGVTTMSDIRVHRDTTTHVASTTRYDAASWANSDSSSNRALQLNGGSIKQNGLSGMAITASRTNGSLSFNIPDNKRYNFSIVSPSKYILGSSTDGTDIQGATISLVLRTGSATTNLSGPTFHTQIGAGVDFTCLYFLCTPTVDHPLFAPTAV